MEFVARVFDRKGKVLVESTGGSILEALEDAYRKMGGTDRRKRPVRQRGTRRGRKPTKVKIGRKK